MGRAINTSNIVRHERRWSEKGEDHVRYKSAQMHPRLSLSLEFIQYHQEINIKEKMIFNSRIVLG